MVLGTGLQPAILGGRVGVKGRDGYFLSVDSNYFFGELCDR